MNLLLNVNQRMTTKLVTALSLATVAFASPQADTKADGRDASIPLTIPAGVPLRLYLTKRVPKRANAPVEARLLVPLYAFDREVIPAGTQVLGHVSALEPIPKWDRTRAVLGGDFTPLRVAQIEFTSLLLPDGRTMELHTVATPGLKSLVPLHPAKKVSPNGQVNNGGVLGTAKQGAKDQMDRIRSIPDVVRGTDKKEWLYDYAMSRLPYHSQSVRNRTRFDAELREPLSFGSATVSLSSLTTLGSQPAPGSTVHARLLTPLDSLTSTKGESVEAVLEQPLFSEDHRLILPEGTRVKGSIAMAQRARWFHRPGRLRFSFESVDLAPEVAELMSTRRDAVASLGGAPAPAPVLQFKTRANISAAENGNAPVKVDKEGGVQATESKTRFIGLALSLMIARAAGDNDRDRNHAGVVTGNSSNVGGRTLGGGLGFGLLGSIAAQSSRNVGAALGYYGLAWNVYSTVIARGSEVQFRKNAVIDIGFNQRESGKAK